MTPLPPTTRPRFLSEADCHDIAQRLARAAQGGGYTTATIVSTWRGNVRWARNQISTAGEDRNDHVVVNRNLRGAVSPFLEINRISDAALTAAARRAERLARLQPEESGFDFVLHVQPEPITAPPLFSEATYQLDAGRRAEAARALVQSATDAGMLSAGYIEVSAHSMAYITSWGYARYFQYTWAQYSVTVRDPTGVGSGWAGVDWPDWSRIDGPKLSAIAVDKCITSRNPVAIEPGRYTTILEAQAVCDLVEQLTGSGLMDRWNGQNGANEDASRYPFNRTPGAMSPSTGVSQLGETVMDKRITISADPMDPDLGFPPFEPLSSVTRVYHPAIWIKDGVLVNLAYSHDYALRELGRSTGLPNSGAFRMSGGATTVEEMIATTRRGLLVTRFANVDLTDQKSLLCRGYTRDGLWLIENGKISKPVKNMAFTESVLFALNNVEQLGPPQRVFHPPGAGAYAWMSIPQPVIVPPLKVRDFSFTALCDAI